MNMGAYFHVAPRLKTCFNENNRASPHQVPQPDLAKPQLARIHATCPAREPALPKTPPHPRLVTGPARREEMVKPQTKTKMNSTSPHQMTNSDFRDGWWC